MLISRQSHFNKSLFHWISLFEVTDGVSFSYSCLLTLRKHAGQDVYPAKRNFKEILNKLFSRAALHSAVLEIQLAHKGKRREGASLF